MNWYKQIKIAKELEAGWKEKYLYPAVGVGALGLGINEFVEEDKAPEPVPIVQPAVPSTTPASPAVPVNTVPQVYQLDRVSLSEDLKLHEGNESHRYYDSKNIPTIGVGYNLRRPQTKADMKSLGLDYNKVMNGTVGLNPAQIQYLLDKDIDEAIAGAKIYIPNLETHPPEVQSIVVNMIFNMGLNKMNHPSKGFMKMKAALLQNPPDYQEAAKQMIDSKWYKDVKLRATDPDTGLVPRMQRVPKRQPKTSKPIPPNAV
jgi:GH24 family phage-related lysozyme (muramidase)